MKTIIIFALMAFAAADDGIYVTEIVDVNALASNAADAKTFVDCVVKKGPCTKLYQQYQDLAAECVKTACKNCSAELKKFGYHFFEMLKTKFPEDFVLFKQLYDPENKYYDALQTEMNKYKN